jgi:HEAT repeat protein/phage FluMu protein Com
MLIYFRCRRCQIALSAATQKADQPVNCPRCKGEIIVPSASEIAPDARKAAIPAPAPPAQAAPVSNSPMPAEVSAKTAPVLAKPTRKQVGRRALVAVAIGMFILVAGGWMTGWAWSKWKQPESQLAANLADSPFDDADVEEVAATGDSPVAVAAGTLQPDILPPDASLNAGVSEDEEDSAAAPRPKVGPEKLPDAKGQVPVNGKLEVKRRKDSSEEDLRKQLLWAPEVGIKASDVPEMAGTFIGDQYQDPGDEHLRLEPSYVVKQVPELKTLPLRRGMANKIDANAAKELHFLGRELHLLVDTHAAMNVGNKPSTVLLGEFMKLEARRDKKPNWLRPEAVPTLQQILGHEDLEVRLLLVDLLTRIDGRASSLALVQHAVFDLSSQVRDAAIKALNGRPREQYRSALVAALRYPWAPAADHAAEALAALKDSDAAPLLVRMLKEPDPAAPVVKKDHFRNDQLWKREVVRIKHMDNCLVCHPPSNAGNEFAQGMVPGFAVLDKKRVVPTSSLSPSLQSLVTGGGGTTEASVVKGANGSGTINGHYSYNLPTASISMSSVAPFAVRGDITYLRQDFSIQQPVRVEPANLSVDLRFDYVVRFRPLTEKQAREWKAQDKRPDTYEQREAVLFALRELTGQDAGAASEAWEKLFPTSEAESQIVELAGALLNASDYKKIAVIKKLQEAKGAAYSEALAQAIPQLEGKYQQKARAALVERMKRMTADTLRDKLAETNREMQRAALAAVVWKEEASLAPELTALLDDPDAEVAEAALDSLKALGIRKPE